MTMPFGGLPFRGAARIIVDPLSAMSTYVLNHKVSSLDDPELQAAATALAATHHRSMLGHIVIGTIEREAHCADGCRHDGMLLLSRQQAEQLLAGLKEILEPEEPAGPRDGCTDCGTHPHNGLPCFQCATCFPQFNRL